MHIFRFQCDEGKRETKSNTKESCNKREVYDNFENVVSFRNLEPKAKELKFLDCYTQPVWLWCWWQITETLEFFVNQDSFLVFVFCLISLGPKQHDSLSLFFQLNSSWSLLIVIYCRDTVPVIVATILLLKHYNLLPPWVELVQTIKHWQEKEIDAIEVDVKRRR